MANKDKKKDAGKVLRRRSYDRIIAGVAGGIADYFEMPVWLVRVLFIVFSIIPGLAVPAYIIIWIIAEEKGYDVSPTTSPRTIR